MRNDNGLALFGLFWAITFIVMAIAFTDPTLAQ